MIFGSPAGVGGDGPLHARPAGRPVFDYWRPYRRAERGSHEAGPSSATFRPAIFRIPGTDHSLLALHDSSKASASGAPPDRPGGMHGIPARRESK